MSRTRFALIAVLALLALAGCERRSGPGATTPATIPTADFEASSTPSTSPTPALATPAAPTALATAGNDGACGPPVRSTPIPATVPLTPAAAIDVPRPLPVTPANVDVVQVGPDDLKRASRDRTFFYSIDCDILWEIRPRGRGSYSFVRGTAEGTGLTVGIETGWLTSREYNTILVDLQAGTVVQALPFGIGTNPGNFDDEPMNGSHLRVVVDDFHGVVGSQWEAGHYDLDLQGRTMTQLDRATEFTDRYPIRGGSLGVGSALPGATAAQLRFSVSSGRLINTLALTGPGATTETLYVGSDRIDIAPDGRHAVRIVGGVLGTNSRFSYFDFATSQIFDLGPHTSSDDEWWSPSGRYLVIQQTLERVRFVIVYDTTATGAPREIARIPDAINRKQGAWYWFDHESRMLIEYRPTTRDSQNPTQVVEISLPDGQQHLLPSVSTHSTVTVSPRSTYLVVHGFGVKGVGLFNRATGAAVPAPSIAAIGEYWAGLSWDERWVLLNAFGAHD